jgi:2-oxoglutarate ferredoxin oxidoreductase subunit delta
MDLVQFNKDRCKGCELCVNFCSRECLGMSKELNAIGYRYAKMVDPEKCNGCGLCADMCPETAMRVYRKCKKAKTNA